MKKTLTIILISISLSGFSQTEKGDTPTVGWNTVQYRHDPSLFESLRVQLPIGFHKYLSDRFAIGLLFYFNYNSINPYVSNQFEQNSTRIGILPEVRYNFLKTRLTPFVAGRVMDIAYQTTFNDIPIIPVELRRISGLNFNTGLQIDVGVSYFIRERFGLQVKLMDVSAGFGNKANFYLPINFGLQFIINNPRSEIESPR